MIKSLSLFLIFIASAVANEKYFDYEQIKTPVGVDSQVGGLTVTPSGNLAVCFHRGEVMVYNLKTKVWTKFAEGLHEPLGIVALSDTEFVVMQRPELTVLKDTDGNGEADLYKTLNDDFGMTGNYHEFSFGPAMDKDGNFFVGLNVASNGASIRNEVRGEFSPIGLPREDFYKSWKQYKNTAGRMYSRVPYRGWIIKITPEGKLIPWSCGVRSPNGLGFDADGNLYVSDNQGDWLGTSKLHHVKKDRFHGHPASLVWREGWSRDPLDVPVKELEELRTKASVLFPQGVMANSPTQPLLIDHDKFGPYKGQMLVGDMNFKRILRFMPDKVNGEIQGAIIPFIEEGKMEIGNNRLAWGKDGSLFIGRTKLSWAGNRGILRVKKKGDAFDVQNVKLTKKGFKFTFTEGVAEKLNKENFKVLSYFYTYHKNYGSPQNSKEEAKLSNVKISADGKTVSFDLNTLREGFVYQFDFKDFKSKSGQELMNSTVCYTLNQTIK
ncbi:MAG: PQQ-dependent sugar dehydrogenase [Lentisphaeraceae bacterium]|nr:PQQ-dependent sugar dehydrogenase [Lentisphaeraceae bacterium]